MQTDPASAKTTEHTAFPASSAPPVPRVYDCIGCRYVDSHGLICDVCLQKILGGQADGKQNRA
jgi:hypothetical protein